VDWSGLGLSSARFTHDDVASVPRAPPGGRFRRWAPLG
jgi:hypothetical protein